jgi:hypothetical protein
VKFEGDPRGGPLVPTPHPFDEIDDFAGRCLRLPMRSRGAVLKAKVAELPVAIDPLRSCRPRDTHLGRNVCDRSRPATLDEASAALDAEGCVGVRHGWAAQARCCGLRGAACSIIRSRSTRAYYRRAVGEIDPDHQVQDTYGDPVVRLGEHVTFMVLSGVGPIDHEVVASYFERAHQAARVRVMDWVGRGVKQDAPGEDWCERARAFFEWRE